MVNHLSPLMYCHTGQQAKEGIEDTVRETHDFYFKLFFAGCAELSFHLFVIFPITTQSFFIYLPLKENQKPHP